MQPEWRAFLEGQGARLTAGEVADFGSPEEELEAVTGGETILADLSHRTLFSLEGSEVLSFLQGQVTSDVEPAAEGTPVLGAHLTPKGRVIAELLLFPLDSGFALETSGDLVEKLGQRLRMFILNADVTLTEASNEWVRLGLAGPEAASAAGAAAEAPSPSGETVVGGQRGTIVALPGPEPAFLVLTPPDTGPAAWRAGAGRARPVGRPGWDLARVRAGVPEVAEAVTEAFIPQELNLEPLGGISYTKGCYTGQEVVARTKHLGRLKRRLYRATSPATMQAGQTIRPQDGGESRGRIIRAAPTPDGGSQALAVLRIDAVEAGETLVPEGSEEALEVLDLPYELPEATH